MTRGGRRLAGLALLLVAIVLAGCGRYGPPVRPKRPVPAPAAQPAAQAPAPADTAGPESTPPDDQDEDEE